MKTMLSLGLMLALLCTACVSQERGSAAAREPASPLYADTATATQDVTVQHEGDVRLWQVHPGLLRTQVEGWATAAGYQVVWKVARDYHLQSSASFEGSLVQALQRLFAGLQERGNSLRVIVYQGNKVILVSEQ